MVKDQTMYPQLPVTWLPDGSLRLTRKAIRCSECVLYPPNATSRPPKTRARPLGCRTVFIGGLPDNVTEEILRDVFGRCGEISSLRMSQKNFAHIRFEMETYVEYAIMLSGYFMQVKDQLNAAHTGRLRCDYAQDRHDTFQQQLPQRGMRRRQLKGTHHEVGTTQNRSELVDLHLRLLKLEQEEEKKQQVTKDGESILKLVVRGADSKQDVYVTILRDAHKPRLPKHCIEQGSQVSVSLVPPNVITKYHSAEVTEVTSDSLTLTFQDEPDIFEGMVVSIRSYSIYSVSTLNLVVRSAESEGDVYVLTLRDEHERRLSKHSLEQGSQVSVSLVPPTFYSAVVTEVTAVSLTLTFQDEPGIFKGMTVFIKQMESLNHTQLSDAMTWLKNVKTDLTNHSDEPAVHLVREMFKEHQHEVAVPTTIVPLDDEASPLLGARKPQSSSSSSPLRFVNQQLDVSQREAVKLALGNRLLTVIHGPPGTGKTTTLVEVILQHVKRGQRVLVCAPSNKAVDNLLESLENKTRDAHCELRMSCVMRLGNLARMDPKNRQFSYKVKLRNHLKMLGHRVTKAEKEEEIAKLLNRMIVVMSTLTSVRSVKLCNTYDLLMIDECAQATEAACWLAIPLARRVLLAGDPWQLPPTILSQEAARSGLAVSLMERQMELHDKGVVHLLDTQYRMHELIQAWSSRHLYHDRLKAAPDVCSRLLPELPGVRSTKRTEPTLLLVDTDGCNLKESEESSSYRNHGEADLVVCHARSLVDAGLSAEGIGVITPYKQQVKLIAGKMRDANLAAVEVNSVDGYQGREKEAILLSLVRSNERGKVGFVKNRRRLNVAVTRARRHLFVVCDTATVCRDETIRSLVRHMEQSGEARSAYCNQCPGGKNEHNPRAALHAADPLVSAAGVHNLQKLTLSADPFRSWNGFEVAPVPTLDRSMEAMRLKRQAIPSSRTATPAQDAKEPASVGYLVKVSDSSDPAAAVCRDETIQSLVRHMKQSAYCDQYPGERDERKPNVAPHASKSQVSATDVQKMRMLTPPARNGSDIAPFSTLTSSIELTKKKCQVVSSTKTATLAQDAKKPASCGYVAKVSISSGSAATMCREETVRRSGVARSAYCDKCPGGKNEHNPRATAHGSDSLAPAPGVQDLRKRRLSVKDDFEVARVPTLASSTKTMMQNRQGLGHAHSSRTDILAQNAKVSNSSHSATKVFNKRGSVVEVVGTSYSAANNSGSCDPALEVDDTYDPAVDILTLLSVTFDCCNIL